MQVEGSSIPCDAVIRAVITRADGSTVDLGVVDASYELTPELQVWWESTGKALADERARQANEQLAGW